MTEARLTPPAQDGRAWLREAGLGLLLLASVLFAYSPALHGGLIIDDDDHLTSPALASLHGLWRIWSELGATHQYYPVLHSAFWLEHRLWGDAVLGYHLVNVALHTGSALLLVALVRRLGLPGGWLAAFLFALHPVCVESVAWISEQKNTLSTLFCLSAALAYLAQEERKRLPGYVLAFGLFALALLSKTATSPLPAALLVILWWKKGRLDWRADGLPLGPWFLAAFASVIPTGLLERRFCAPYSGELSLSLIQRVLLAGRSFWFYLGKLFWPAHLSFVYPRWSLDPRAPQAYLYPAASVVLLGALVLLARRSRGPLAASLLFAGFLSPVLGFISLFWFVLSWVGDHLQYLACLPVFVLVCSGAAHAARRLPDALRWLACPCAAALLAVLAALTWRQSGLYRSPETLYRATLARNPDCWMAHYNLGNVWFGEPGRRLDVIAEWETTLRLEPNFADGQNNLGCLLAADPARIPEALSCFEAALRARPDFVDAHNNYGCVLENLPGRTPEAIVQFEAAVRLDPDSAEAQNNLGNVLMDAPGRLPEAVRHLEAAVRQRPGYADARWNLALALIHTPGGRREAVEDLNALLRVKPDLADARDLLSRLNAVRSDPSHAQAPSSHDR